MKKINLVRGQVLAPQEPASDQEGDQEAVREGGVSPRGRAGDDRCQSDTSKNRVLVKVTIDEGKEVQVDNIRFEGNVAFDEGRPARGDGRDVREALVEVLVLREVRPEEIRRRQEADPASSTGRTGTATPQILSDSIWYTRRQDGHEHPDPVHEGPQYKIRHITWQGNTVYPDAC